jgi:hypothetical protein
VHLIDRIGKTRRCDTNDRSPHSVRTPFCVTASKEFRAFVLTSPVVLATRVRKLASDVERFAAWPFGDHGACTIAAGRQSVSIFHDRDLWSVFPLDVGDPVRVVTSPEGRWAVIEGKERTVRWRRAEPCRCDVPPRRNPSPLTRGSVTDRPTWRRKAATQEGPLWG